jgi:hypothetical protein
VNAWATPQHAVLDLDYHPGQRSQVQIGDAIYENSVLQVGPYRGKVPVQRNASSHPFLREKTPYFLTLKKRITNNDSRSRPALPER